MTIIETTWTPSTRSVSKKNTKDRLAWVIMDIWRDIQDCKDETTKKKVIEHLLGVL